MSEEGTDRTRRWRERKEKCAAGDHSMCSPRTKCPQFSTAPVSSAAPVTSTGDVTGDVTPPLSAGVTNVPPPAGLGTRGASLWERSTPAGMGALHLVVLEEACRIADTLERLHGMAEGGDWLELARNESESSASVVEVRVVVNPLLAEIRQQQQVFRQKVAELRVAGRASAPPVPLTGATPESDDADEGGIGDLIDAAGRFTSQG